MGTRLPERASSTAGQQAKTPRRRNAWWLVAIVAIFAVNYWVGTRATKAPARVHVPYSPFFINQIAAGKVGEITSKGTAVQGTFRHAERYAGSSATTRF